MQGTDLTMSSDREVLEMELFQGYRKKADTTHRAKRPHSDSIRNATYLAVSGQVGPWVSGTHRNQEEARCLTYDF